MWHGPVSVEFDFSSPCVCVCVRVQSGTSLKCLSCSLPGLGLASWLAGLSLLHTEQLNFLCAHTGLGMHSEHEIMIPGSLK